MVNPWCPMGEGELGSLFDDLDENYWMVDFHFTRYQINFAGRLWVTVNTGLYTSTANGPVPTEGNTYGVSEQTLAADPELTGTGFRRVDLDCFAPDGFRRGNFFAVRFRPTSAEPVMPDNDVRVGHGIYTQETGVVAPDDGIEFFFESGGAAGGTWKLRANRAAAGSQIDTGLAWDTADYHTLVWVVTDDSIDGSGDEVAGYLDGTRFGIIRDPVVQPDDGAQPVYNHMIHNAVSMDSLVMRVDRVTYGRLRL